MNWRAWLGRLFGHLLNPTRVTPVRRRRRTRLWTEQLEPRCVPALITLASFNGSNGASPWAGLTLDTSGNLFGSAQTGGLHNSGTVFELLKGSGTILPLATFDGNNGLYPNGVVEDSGNLFGTTVYGGSSNWGAVFEVKQGSGAITTLATFSGGADGAVPYSSLTEDPSGNLFGTTTQAGAYGNGTVFELHLGSGTLTTLASFNGAGPGGLIVDGSGNLFGCTSSGGASGNGTVFEVQSGSGTITTLASFNGANGMSPSGPLALDSDGNLFGTTEAGGPFGQGTVFEVQQGSDTITTLAVFSGPNGTGPIGGVIADASGNLFGTTRRGGASSKGTVFELAKGGSSITVLANFNGTNGSFPAGTVVLDTNGNLFGTTPSGGAQGYGTVFEVPLQPSIINTYTLPDWTINLPGYKQKIGTTGTTGTVTFSQTGGTLPTGLTLSSDGTLSGTPTAEGAFPFTVTATDSVGKTGSQTYTVIINPLVSISTPTLANWTVNVPDYNQTISATGGTGTKTFATTGGALPTGLTLSRGGVLSGTPTVARSFTFTVTATDTLGVSGSQTYSVTISPLPFITTSSLPDWTVHQPGYNQTISAVGGTGPLTFSPALDLMPLSAKLPTGRWGLAAADGTDGTIYAIGGESSSGPSSEVDAYNPKTGAWTPVTSLPTARSFLAAAAGADGTIYAIGGSSSAGVTSEVDAYHPQSNTWSKVASLPAAREWLAATAGADGTIYAIGGDTPSFSSYFSSEVDAYDPKTDTWSKAASLPAARSQLAAATGSDGTIYAIGGANNSPFGASNEVDAYNPVANTWVPVASLPNSRHDLAAVTGSDGTIYALGGTIGSELDIPTSEVDAYSPASNTWAAAVGQLPTPRGNLAGAVSRGTIYAIGGGDSVDEVDTVTPLPPGLTLSSSGVLSGTPTTTGTYTFTIKATDALGAVGGHSYTITVNPGPFSQYLVTIVGSSTVQAGRGSLAVVQAADAYGNPVTSYGGPAAVTATISPTSPGSSFPTTVAIDRLGQGYFLANVQRAGTYTISVADSTGTFTGSAEPLTVEPGPAVKLAFGTQPQGTPTGNTLPTVTVHVEDLYGNLVTSDNADTVTLAVASGPGSFTAGSTTTMTVHNGLASFPNLVLVIPGSYTLSAIVPSEYTGPNSASFTVAPLQVKSFAPTLSGFSLQFNAPFLVNSTTPVLYGQGFGATAPVPSVTFTGPTGPVEGSLVVDATTNTITFVQTNTASLVNNNTPILPFGGYHVVVHASAATNGFQALNSGGGFLDGLRNGSAGSGDFTAGYVMDPAAFDVLWVPATADGPGQALSAPGMNQTGGGYPVYLDDSTGNVTEAQATLTYDRTLLTVTPTSTSTFTVTVPSAGTAVLHYSGPALASGTETPLGFIIATVPSGTAASPTPYRAKDLLHLSNVTLNGGAIPIATSDALHLVAYVGDANGDGAYTSDDAVRITRVTLQTDSGFTAYPLVDPVIVADTDGAGFIPADAPLQANEAGIGFPTANLSAPPIPPGVFFQAIANNVDPTVSIPATLHVDENGTVTVPVNIDDAYPDGSTGLIEAHLALTYDHRLFTVSAADFHLGSVLAAGRGWNVVPTINTVTGEIAIALSSTTPIMDTAGGSLVTIDLHQTGNQTGSAPIELVASVNPSGQQVISTELEDAQGTFTLIPAPTNGFDSRIDGMVMLSANSAAVVGTAALAAPVEFRNLVSMVDPLGATDSVRSTSEVTTNSPALVSEFSEQPLMAGQGTLAEATVPVTTIAIGHGNTTFAAAISQLVSTGLVKLVAPIAGLTFQFGNVSPFSGLGTGIGVGQQPDQVFQTLGRGTINSTLLATVKDVSDRIFAGHVALSPSAADNQGSQRDDVTSSLEWQGIVLAGHRIRRDAIADIAPPPKMVQHAVADLDALDWSFAQMADDAELATDD